MATAIAAHKKDANEIRTNIVAKIDAKSIVARAFANRKRWDRSQYIGASEIAACPLKLYYDKTEPKEFTGNGKTERGNAIEVALIRLLKEGGLDIRYHAGHVNHQKEIVHDTYPVVCHPDGIIYQGSKPVAILEVKSVGSEYFRRIKEPLASWVVQARFNAYMAGLPKAILIAVNASDLEDLKQWEFDAMSESEAKEYLQKAKKVFAAIELGVEPIAQPSEESCKWCDHKEKCHTRWLPDEAAKEREVQADEETESAIEKLLEAKELKAKAKELEDEAKAAILQKAKDSEAAKIISDFAVVSIIRSKGRVSIDTKKLFAEHPEIDRSRYEKRGKETISIKVKEIA